MNVPTNSILTIHNQTVMVHPIMDRYYDRNPHHRRSTAFVRTKGLSANEKGTSRSETPLGLAASSIPSIPSLPQLFDHHHHLLQEQPSKRFLGPTIPTSIFSTRTRTSEGLSSASASSLSTIPRARTPLAHAEPAPSDSPQPPPPPTTTSDVRALTAPPLIRAGSSQSQQQQQQAVPAQGNIKKKRASLSALEAAGAGAAEGAGLAYFDTSPVTPEPVRTEFGNPNKIAQLFPELALQ